MNNQTLTPNRYAQIHILFRVLAKKKLPADAQSPEITAKAQEVKAYWKKFFHIESLTELDDTELYRLTETIRNRIRTLQDL